ncbi:S-adenosyl-L-methionine-dependent methyltransferase [Gautieria morchelliformis]|nr:S-adenosyl-L-methionine-dependent methyltransferase [Gautieria morchelliformis]
MLNAESNALSDGRTSSAHARRRLTSAVAAAILDAVAFDDRSTLVMDYACGSGGLSQKLASYCKSIIGIDIDQAAVDQYNNKVANQGIPSEEMRAICTNLHEHSGELNGQLFDVIVCSQAYHHFPSINATTCLLASFLKHQTGILLVSDLLKGPHEHEFRRPCSHTHNHHAVVHRGGLTENEVRGSFEEAGLVDIDFEIVHTVKKDGRDVEVFMAQGVRPAGETLMNAA